MTMTTLANAQIITETDQIHGAVSFDGMDIVAVDSGSSVPAGAIDCEGDYIAPGLIELHTDNLERHLQPRPGVHWPKRAAVLSHDREIAGAGITTVFDALRVGSDAKAKGKGYLRYARETADQILGLRREGVLKTSHHIHLRAELCTETLVDEMSEFSRDDRVGLVSLMDHTPGQRQFRDVTKLRQYLMGKHGFDEDGIQAHFKRLTEMQGLYLDKHRAHAVDFARQIDAILASHDDTTIDDVSMSHAQGVIVAEFPTTVEAATACRKHQQFIMMGAPNVIRGGSHSGNVAAMDLAGQGLLDILSSDYVPAALLMAAVRLGREANDMVAGLRTVTAMPADAAGLHDRGRLMVGKRADIVRFAVNDDLPLVRGVWNKGRQVA